MILAGIRATRFEWEQGLDELEGIIDLATRVGNRRAAVLAAGQAVMVLGPIGPVERAVELYQSAETMCREYELYGLLDTLNGYLVEALFWSGRREQCLAHSRAGLDYALRNVGSIWGAVLLGGIAACTDDPDEREWVTRAGEERVRMGTIALCRHIFYVMLAERAIEEGDAAATRHWADALEATFEQPNPLTSLMVAGPRLLADDRARPGWREDARRMRKRIERAGIGPALARIDAVLATG